MNEINVGDTLKLQRHNCNSKGSTITIQSIEDHKANYVYEESGLYGAAAINKEFLQTAEKVGTGGTFWLVWLPNSSGAPYKKHFAKHEAEQELERLLKTTQHKEGYVVQAVTHKKINDIITKRF